MLGTTVSGVVVVNGQPLVGATVTLTAIDGTMFSGKTGADGSYSVDVAISADPYTLSVEDAEGEEIAVASVLANKNEEVTKDVIIAVDTSTSTTQEVFSTSTTAAVDSTTLPTTSTSTTTTTELPTTTTSTTTTTLPDADPTQLIDSFTTDMAEMTTDDV